MRERDRSRHPSAKAWIPDLGRLTARVATTLATDRSMPFPAVAAAVLSARGSAGDEPAAFARRVGVSESWLTALEAGRVPSSGVPGSVRELAPWAEWDGLD